MWSRIQIRVAYTGEQLRHWSELLLSSRLKSPVACRWCWTPPPVWLLAPASSTALLRFFATSSIGCQCLSEYSSRLHPPLMTVSTHWASLLQGRMQAGDRHRWSVKPPFGSTRRHVCATDEDRIWPTQFPRRSSSRMERASNSSPLNHHFSSTVQSWVEDLPLQPGVLHRQPLRTFVEECIDLLTYLLT